MYKDDSSQKAALRNAFYTKIADHLTLRAVMYSNDNLMLLGRITYNIIYF